MKTILTAIALTIALPAATFAQAQPAPASNPAGNMQGMSMDGMNMQKMSCKDMHAMMAKGHSMHMSKADMQKMCPDSSKAAPKAGGSDAHQGHSSH